MLHKTEVKCFMCGTLVVADTHKIPIQQRICSGLKFAFVCSSVLTVASLFFDATPSFTKCSVATLILGLAKSSADQMGPSNG
jgi:hypothetical protein